MNMRVGVLDHYNVSTRRLGETVRFYERREVRDIVAYLRVLDNPGDSVSMRRILNTPRRGIGRKTLETLVALSEKKATRLYSAITMATHAADSPLSSRAMSSALRRSTQLFAPASVP